MIKRLSLLAAVGLLVFVATESESLAQFGGYHGAAARARAVNVGRGVNVGVRAAPFRYGGYGYGYGRALPYGSYGDAYGNVYLPPNPGKGPAGISSIGSGNKRADDLRGSSQATLNAALNQMRLPSDAGLPAGKDPKK